MKTGADKLLKKIEDKWKASILNDRQVMQLAGLSLDNVSSNKKRILKGKCNFHTIKKLCEALKI